MCPFTVLSIDPLLRQGAEAPIAHESPQTADRAWLNGITRAVAVAVAMSNPWGSRSDASSDATSPSRWTTRPLPRSRPGRDRPQEADVQVEGGLEPIRREGGDQR